LPDPRLPHENGGKRSSGGHVKMILVRTAGVLAGLTVSRPPQIAGLTWL
jgi:hypothetical protein